MARPIELRHLRYFVAIAEEGGLTRAAERLHIQQPPLSQQLQVLEEALGMRLFERLPRGVEPTAAGAAFLEDARAILASVDGARARVRRVAAGDEGAITIGLASSAATHPVVPQLLALQRERHPRVHVRFVEGNAASLTEAVLAGQANVALVRAPVDRPRGVRFERLLQEPMLAAVAKAHPLARKARGRKPPWVELRELAAHPFILVRRPGAPGMYGDLLAACAEAGLATEIAAEVGNMLTNILLVAAGVGVSVVPASMRGIQGELVDYLPLRGAGRLVAPLTLISLESDANPCVGPFRALARTRGPRSGSDSQAS
jgi:DNA-binding transcriptional LysR family regulator